MNAAELVDRAAQAVRGVKYRCTGVVAGQRRVQPPSMADRRYAVAATSELLRDLAEAARQRGPIPGRVLDQLANDIEKQEPPR